MKKIILPFILIGAGYGLFYYLFNKPKKITPVAKIEKAIPKKNKNTRPEKIDFDDKEEIEEDVINEPAPTKEISPSASTVDRKFIGPDFKPMDAPPNNVVYENKINPDWENLLIKEFFDGERPDGNIEVRRLESFVYFKGNTGLYVEKVLVNVAAPKEMAGTFYAYVDSGSGEIIHAWEGNEDTPSEEVYGTPEEGIVDYENQGMDIPESTIEEGIEFSEEEMGSHPSEDTYYPEYN